MYKSIMSKNWRWGVAIETFSLTAKELSKVYHTGIRFWKDSRNVATLAFVIYRFRLMFYFPWGKERGCCAG